MVVVIVDTTVARVFGEVTRSSRLPRGLITSMGHDKNVYNLRVMDEHSKVLKIACLMSQKNS